MSQIAHFTYLKESDVPLLGFWSKPKPRLFGKPESKFDVFLHQHALREVAFEEGDGIYVALVFAWLDLCKDARIGEVDPVIETVRKHVGGSHWLLKRAHQVLLPVLQQPIQRSEWLSLLEKLDGASPDDYAFDTIEKARRFVDERLTELSSGNALLISVG